MSSLRERARWAALVSLFLGVAAAPGPSLPALAAETPALPVEPLLVPGQPAVERSIAPEEAQVFRLRVEREPLRLTLEQRGVDVTLAVAGPLAEGVGTDAGDCRWGPEVLLFEEAGERRIEVRAKTETGWPGRYAIHVEPVAEPPAPALRAAWSLTRQAGEAAFLATADSRGRAMALYREALPAWRSLGDLQWEAESLTRLASLEAATADRKRAAQDFEQAAALWQKLGEEEREAAARNELGLALRNVSRHEDARAALDTSRALWQRLGHRLDEVETASNLCLLEQTAGDLNAALACYDRPLAVYQEVKDRAGEGRIWNNRGGIHEQLGDAEAALESYERALALRRAVGKPADVAQTLSNLGVLHRTLGEWQEALRLYSEARTILERSGPRDRLGTVLNNTGYTYYLLGETERALLLLEESLKVRREVGDRAGEITTLNNLGLARRQLGDTKAALDLHTQAQKRAAELGDVRQEAVSRMRLAEILLPAGDSAAALDLLRPALAPLQAAGLRKAELQVRQLEGRALLRSGKTAEALAVLREVLAGRRALRDPSGEPEALYALALAERAASQEEAARAHAEEAVARVEELRNGISSPDLRASFLATRRQVYSLLIDLLMDRHRAELGAGWDRKAFAVSEQAHARGLLDALASPASGGVAGAVPQPLLDRRRSLHRRLSLRAVQLANQANSAKIESLGREVEALLADLDSVEAEMRRADPRYAALSRPQSASVDEVHALLEPGTALLELALGEERSHLWLIEGGELQSLALPPQREIEELARQAYAELSVVEAGGGGHPAAAKLARLLFAGAWSRASKAHRWVVVSDGALHTIPFAALPAPDGSGQLLLDRLEIDALPSATTLAELRRRPPTPAAPVRAAIFADPVFSPDDPRLAPRAAAAAPRDSLRGAAEGLGEAPAFERLVASAAEAEAIAQIASIAKTAASTKAATVPVGEVRVTLGFAANRSAVLAGALRGAQVVHFATHAVASTRTPELSGLILSQVDEAGRPIEGFLGLAEIYDLRLDADLVVLSGCGTAFGKEVRGEGLMGLTRAFLYAGVPRVVASLWPVRDRAASELMRRFYRALWQEGLPPAAALRQAQVELRRDPRNRRYRDPFYWAGYVLQGDWR